MAKNPATVRMFLVRHGEVADEWHGRVYGDHDVPLSPRGEREAFAAARRLAGVELDAVVSSGLARAEFGAAALRRERNLARRDEPDLRELSRGAWVGMRIDEVPNGQWQAWLDAPSRHRPPDGESLADLAARVLPRLDALARELDGGTAALVVHSWVIRVAVCTALGLHLDTAPRLTAATGGMTILDWTVGPDGQSTGVVAGFDTDAPPPAGPGWYRGPSRR